MCFELNNSSLWREQPSYLAVCYLVIINIVLQIPWVLPCSCVVLLFITGDIEPCIHKFHSGIYKRAKDQAK